MNCHVCGGKLKQSVTSLPFRLSSRAILVIKELPVLECVNCTEFSLDDEVMVRVEELIAKVDKGAELEVVNFAA